MDEISHPLMAAHVPSFITRPGETDTLLVVVGIFLILLIIGLGILYFRLHALPEQISHRATARRSSRSWLSSRCWRCSRITMPSGLLR